MNAGVLFIGKHKALGHPPRRRPSRLGSGRFLLFTESGAAGDFFSRCRRAGTARAPALSGRSREARVRG